jgi:hypothetical protein
MLDKLKNNDKNGKDASPNLRKPSQSEESGEVGDKIRGLVSKVSSNGTKEQNVSKPKLKVKSEGGNEAPRPMPKPKVKPNDEAGAKTKLKPKVAPKKRPSMGKTNSSKSGSSRPGFGGRVPDDDQKTLVGAIVFGVILVILVSSLYYFLVYQPYQENLDGAKDTKYSEIDTYFKNGLASDPLKQTLTSQVASATTPEEVLSIDIIGPATTEWRKYQTQELNSKKDKFNRVMVAYSTNPDDAIQTSSQPAEGEPSTPQTENSENKKEVIMNLEDTTNFIKQADALVLANMVIETPDTVAVPIMISRLQAAAGLVSVGNSVDVYLKKEEEGSSSNETNETAAPPTSTNEDTPEISGATVLAILRAKDSGAVDASLLTSQALTMNQASSTVQNERVTNTDVEQLLRAAASGSFNKDQTAALLQNYGITLSNYERSSNLGELDAQYLVLLEVPREDVSTLIQNPDSVMLTVPTQSAPTWMIKEMKSIYK